MRLRICRRLQGSIDDGVAIDHLQNGLIHEIGTQVALAQHAATSPIIGSLESKRFPACGGVTCDTE